MDDELEFLMLQNPRGGRPQKIGASIYVPLEPKNSLVEISEITESSVMRFHLGYCACGKKIVAGERRALVLIKKLQDKLGIHSLEDLQTQLLAKVMRQ